jgi:hypothetical protein
VVEHLRVCRHVGFFFLNSGTTWHSLQEKLDEVRHKGEATKQAVAETRTNLEQRVTEKRAEAKTTIDQWKTARLRSSPREPKRRRTVPGLPS